MREIGSSLVSAVCFVLLLMSQGGAAEESVVITHSDGNTQKKIAETNVTIEVPAASPYQVFKGKVFFIAKTKIPDNVTSAADWEMTIEFKNLPAPGQYLPAIVPLKTASLTPAGYANVMLDLPIGKWQVRARITKPTGSIWTDWRAFEVKASNTLGDPPQLSAYCAQYTEQPLPPQYYKWAAGSSVPFQMKVKNCGGKGWSILSPAPAGALENVKLIYRITSGTATSAVAVPLVQSDVLVPAGGTAAFSGSFAVPTARGNYTITWDMREGETTFSSKGVGLGFWHFVVE